MAVAPDGRIFVCQQGGSLRVIKNGALLATPVVTLTVDGNGERGLLGRHARPELPSEPVRLRLLHGADAAVHNRLSRFTVNGDVAVPGSEFVLLELDNLSGATNHNGGAIHFGPDGKLYVAVGDNANGANAQSLTILFGRSCASTRTARSRPTIRSSTRRPENTRASGPSGCAIPSPSRSEKATPSMLINDVGQVTYEEINVGGAGLNYGWPTCEGPFLQGTSTPCNNSNFTDPLYYYPHTGGACAITGGDFYEPQVPGFPSQYLGQYFFGDYCGDWIQRIDPTNGAETDFALVSRQSGRHPDRLRRQPLLPVVRPRVRQQDDLHRQQRPGDHAGPSQPADLGGSPRHLYGRRHGRADADRTSGRATAWTSPVRTFLVHDRRRSPSATTGRSSAAWSPTLSPRSAPRRRPDGHLESAAVADDHGSRPPARLYTAR